MIAPPKQPSPVKLKETNFGRIILLLGGIFAVAAVALYLAVQDDPSSPEKEIAKPLKSIPERTQSVRVTDQPGESSGVRAKQETVVDAPKTNQWGNPAHWGHKKLRPAKVHAIDRSQMPLFEQVFSNRADKTIAGLLVIEPGTDLIGEEVFDESFVKAFLKSIETPIVVSKDDDEETKALKRAVIETKIELKARLDAGEDIAKTLTEIRRELRELGAYREELKKLIDEKSRDRSMSTADMKDFVSAANIMLDERGAKPIVMPEFYCRQLEIRNQKIKELRGE